MAQGDEFISEDDLDTFEGWLRYQCIDAVAVTKVELATLRGMFDEAQERKRVNPKIGSMKLVSVPGEHRYAVAVRDSGLWLGLWVRRSRKGEFFVMLPRGDRDWDPHTSYHLDGTVHFKSFKHKHHSQKRQPLTNSFRGTEHLGASAGFAPKGIGAICDPAAFSGVVEVAPGLLGPRHGTVIVDLVAPECEPISWPTDVIQSEVFRDVLPWVVIRICRD